MASGLVRRRLEERREVARDRRVGNVRQPEFPENALLFLLRLVVETAERQEAFEREFEYLLARDLGPQRSADQSCAGAEDRNLDLSSVRDREQSFFGGGTLPAKALRWRSERGASQFGFDQPASVRSRLSPPSSRCLPTAVRVNSTRRPRDRRGSSVKSLVPPPTSQTSTVCPSNSSSATARGGSRSRNRTPRRALRAASDSRCRPARAASTVSSRASSSKEAGTVSTTSARRAGASLRFPNASRIWRR